MSSVISARPQVTRSHVSPDRPQLSREHIELLRVLVTGATDEQAADALGISRRTLGRRLREVMDLLGADSRFQAGYLAACRGLRLFR